MALPDATAAERDDEGYHRERSKSMGKRELLLIAGFVLAGVMVYYATVPAGEPGSSDFSISKLLAEVRREMRGNPASAELKTSTTTPLRSGTTELRLETGTPLTIVGEKRDDVVFDLNVWSNGPDEAEAKRFASETHLKIAESGSALIVGMEYPEPGQQRASLAIRVPKSLTIRIQPTRSKLDISDVESVELVESRGPVTLRRVTGKAIVSHRGGMLTLESLSSLKLNARGSSVVTIKDLKGDAVMQLQAGELRGTGIIGPLDVESNGTRIFLEDLGTTRKPIKLSTVGGSITLAGLATETRIDARDTRVDVTIEKPAPIAIYTEGDQPATITLPAGGVSVDALAMNSKLFLPDGLLEIKSTEHEQRASGAVDGGGPTITLRSSRGNITIKTKKPSDTAQ
jgi:hypothetical protein